MKRKILGALGALLLIATAHAGWHATPAVDSQGRTIYQRGPGGLPMLPPGASPLSHTHAER